MMKKLSLEEIQQNSFNVLLKLKKIFDNNQWVYYLGYGTLLGAVRHQGFIPWDDDIDIWVPRATYEKFIDYCIKNKEALKPYELIHYKTNDKYIFTLARFSDSRYRIDYKNVKDYNLGLFVDVYPLDGVNENDMKFMKKMKHSIKSIWFYSAPKFMKSSNIVKTIIKAPYYFLVRNRNVTKMNQKNDLKGQKYSFEDSKYFDCVVWDHANTLLKKEWLGNGRNAMFNGVEFRIPENYDALLKAIYGDYMQLPPENERIAHHEYDAYEKEDKQ